MKKVVEMEINKKDNIVVIPDAIDY